MSPAYFRPAERELILGKLAEWEALKGVGKERDDDGDLFSPKDRLVDKIVEEFFQAFPDRDFTKRPGSPVAMTQEERDKLHTVSVLPLTWQILTTTMLKSASSNYSIMVLHAGRVNLSCGIRLIASSRSRPCSSNATLSALLNAGMSC
jgi:hypothetical protein